MTPDTEARLRLLEAHVVVQEQVMTALQAERIESSRLSESVVMLGDGATLLSEALLQVDRNQQALTRLGKAITAVEEKVTPKDELEATQAANLASLRRADFQRAVIGGLLVLLACAGVGTGVALREAQQRDSYANCLRAQGATTGVVAYLEAVVEESTNPKLASTAQALVETFQNPTPCEEP